MSGLIVLHQKWGGERDTPVFVRSLIQDSQAALLCRSMRRPRDSGLNAAEYQQQQALHLSTLETWTEEHTLSVSSQHYTPRVLYSIYSNWFCVEYRSAAFCHDSCGFIWKSPNKIQRIVQGSTEINEWERERWSERERERDSHTTASAHGTQHTGDTTSTRTSSLIVQGVYRAPCLALCLAYIGSGGFFLTIRSSEMLPCSLPPSVTDSIMFTWYEMWSTSCKSKK